MTKGSITVFATLVMMLVAQFVFTLLEAGRSVELSKIADINSEAAIESVFAQYCQPLWDEYRLLGYDASNDGEFSMDMIDTYMKDLCSENFEIETDVLKNSTNLLRLSLEETEFDKYSLITDAGVYAKQVSSYMKKNLPYELAKSAYNQYESIKNASENSGYNSDSVSDAIGALSSKNAQGGGASISPISLSWSNNKGGQGSGASLSSVGSSGNNSKGARVEEASLSSVGSSGNNSKGARVEGASLSPAGSSESNGKDELENPLVKLQEAKASGTLALVLDEKTLSGNTISTERVSSRTLQKGSGYSNEVSDWYEKILLESYYTLYLSNYMDQNDNHVMKYEMEYLIGGAKKDADNLRIVVDEILAIRSGINFMYLMSSPSKIAEASAMATTLAGVTANPAIIEVVKIGLLAGWAYSESILDLRTIMSGDKVPIIKSDLTWTSGLGGISQMSVNGAKAKSSDTGMGYKEYLCVLLMLGDTQTQVYRAMDVQEATIRQLSGYENFKMDNVICKLSTKYTYEYHGLFMSFVYLLNGVSNEFNIKNSKEYAYY